MHRIGRFVFQGQVRALLVVDQDCLPHHLLCLRQVCRPVEQEFGLQDAVDPFGQGVLVAIVAIGHRARNAMLGMELLIKH
ncbi:hypothetical protein D3C85_978710 [compost metagenome]